MKTDFVSLRDGDLDSQEGNFIEKLQIHKTALRLKDDEVADATGIINQHRNSYRTMTSKKSEAKSAIEENHRQKINSLAEFRRIAKQIKSSKYYTASIERIWELSARISQEKILLYLSRLQQLR